MAWRPEPNNLYERTHLQPRRSGLTKVRTALRTALGYLLFVIIPIACFYLVETFTHDPREMKTPIQVINVIFYLILLLFLFGLTGRIRIAAIITTVLSFGIGFANSSVVALRGSPILPWDLLSLNTALSVSGNYKIPFTSRFWYITLATAAVLILTLFARLRLRKILLRLGLIACSLMLIGFYIADLHDMQFTKNYKFNDTLFTPDYLYMQNGFAASFLINLKYLKVDEPAGYAVDQVANLVSGVEAALAQDSEEKKKDATAPADRPNILVVMDEAFSDLSLLADFKTNEDYMPFFRSLTENTVRGNVYVSIVGGNTATTEFEFLTGDSMAFLPAGSVAYQQYIQADLPGLPAALKERGYQTVAMHPYVASGWDRDKVYQFLSFDKVLFEKDFYYRQRLRQYVSDRSVFRQLIREFDKKDEGAPLFAFAVTMQNHGGYGTEYANFTPAIKVLEENLGDNIVPTEQYLSLIKETDIAFQEFVEHFMNVDEKTIILLFGDHQPNDYILNPLLALEKNKDSDRAVRLKQDRFAVPFVIWANYDIAERSHVEISANFLSELLLDTAGVPETEYNYFLSTLQTRIPVMTASFFRDASGKSFDYAAANDEQKSLIGNYAILQFNHLFDQKNRMGAFFK